MIISSNINQAVQYLKEGRLVAFPTETVYGLGADASNAQAVKKIFAAKGRPLHHPLIVHIANLAQLTDWAFSVDERALTLANHFWPGPLTLILPKKKHVSLLVTGGQDTVGIRIPKHPIAKKLLDIFRDGVAAPSANKFTHVSPTSALAVQQELGDQVNFILDGGNCSVGLESTIVDLSSKAIRLLRPGMITRHDIESLLGEKVELGSSTVRAPGSHFLHYAPRTQTLFMAANDIQNFLHECSANDLPVVVLTYTNLFTATNGIHFLTMPANPDAYAHVLYRRLRAVDQQKFKYIVVEMVPNSVEWDAIRDRLFKASYKVTSNDYNVRQA